MEGKHIHHASCKPNEKELIWFCSNCAARENAENILSALREAKEALRKIHLSDNRNDMKETAEHALAKLNALEGK